MSGEFFDDPAAFARAPAPPESGPATARGVLLIEPVGMRLSHQTARDNAYMDLSRRIDPERALAQHRVLARAIATHTRLPVQVFAGSSESPDAVFPNNVFATVPGRVIVGAMRHPERQYESRRGDIIDWLAREDRGVIRLDADPAVVAELTGPLVLDRARAVGYHGLTERCNHAGAAAMHRAFDLAQSFAFALAAGEYHTNVVMTILAGRTLLLHRDSLADPAAADAIAARFPECTLWLDDAEKAGFVGNSIALAPDQVWMSATAERALSAPNRERLRAQGYVVHTVAIDEIEKAGGSLRCCIAEIF
jgi:hypothetical protein